MKFEQYPIQGKQAFINDQNKAAEAWAKKMLPLLRANIARLSNKGKGELARELKQRVLYYKGRLSGIAFDFPVHGIYFQRGAGRGYKVVDGKVMRVYKMGNKQNYSTTLKRVPKDWAVSAINAHTPQLAEQLAATIADQLVDVSKIDVSKIIDNINIK